MPTVIRLIVCGCSNGTRRHTPNLTYSPCGFQRSDSFTFTSMTDGRERGRDGVDHDLLRGTMIPSQSLNR